MPEPSTERARGKLTEQEQAEANRNHSQREDQPADVFLEPSARKYPVKTERDGKWIWDRDLLLAAAREARLHGHADLAKRADEIRNREFGAADDYNVFALDAESVRSFDKDGRLHVKMTPISKAMVSEYYGQEIPEASKLGLEPTKKYKLLRDPGEIQKGMQSANNLPVMIKHIKQSADDPQKDSVVGSLGTDATFDGPYLKNSMIVWDQKAIDGIQDKSRRQISMSYRYAADMTPGVYGGEQYDGVMRDIEFNHAALVEDGRCGPDVLVEDSLPHPPGVYVMAKISRRALVAQGAVAAKLGEVLAADAKIPSLKSLFAGVNRANWQESKPVVLGRLKKLVPALQANDAKMEDFHKMLDGMDKEGDGEPDEMDVMDRRRGRDSEPGQERQLREAGGTDIPEEEIDDADPDGEGLADKIFQHLDGKIDPELMKGIREIVEKHGAVDRARDEDPAIKPGGKVEDRARDRRARDETPEEREKREREDKERREKERAEDKRANDAAIQKAVLAERQRNSDIQEALRVVKPMVGSLPGLAVDAATTSAESIYRTALSAAKVDHEAIKELPALRALCLVHTRHKSEQPRMAADSASRAISDDLAKKFGLDRIRSI